MMPHIAWPQVSLREERDISSYCVLMADEHSRQAAQQNIALGPMSP